MAPQEVTIKCGRCKVPVEGPANPQDKDRFACPRCGNGDTLKNIMVEAHDSATDQAAEHLDRQIKDMFRGVKGATYTPGARVKKARRFIVEMKL